VTTYLLIRHATNDWVGNRIAGWTPGVHLNEEGQKQAAALAAAWGDWPIAALYSSPLERARETAGPLAGRLGLPIQLREAFGELHYGEWEGRSLRELADDPRWQRFNACRGTTRIPGGELLLETAARAMTELEQLRARHAGEWVAVFSHGDVIRAVLMQYAGMPFDLIQRIEISPASVSVVELHDSGPRIKCVNLPAVLSPLQLAH